MQKIEDVSQIIPLFLEGSAYAVYSQLDKATQENAGDLETALLNAFSMNAFQAYEELRKRVWSDNEPVDVFLADLKRLARLANISDVNVIQCAFIVGLPPIVSGQMRASAQISKATLPTLVEQARVLMTEYGATGSTVAAGVGTRRQFRERRDGNGPRCFKCGEEGHIARNCTKIGKSDPAKPTIKCFVCGEEGHVARSCSSRPVRGCFLF